MTSVIEEIKSRLSIVEVASGYIKLEKAGGNFKACCPFHNERTPSFYVSPARQTYHCFGCNRGGDIISFVEEIEGLDFSGALKVLAERAGVELKRERKELRDEREGSYLAIELATKFYEAVLPRFPEAVSYLKKRGLTDATIKHFRIGFAPDEWRSLNDFLKKKNVADSVIEHAGLVVRTEKGFYDRFRGRVMFPLLDSSGRVVAFSARILKEGEGKTLGSSASAKYVNSPETEIFHKSKVLFGFNLAKESMRKEDSAVLVEGQLDLILSHQAGVTNAVASSGTALTVEHLALIKRFTDNLILALDADKAGLSATHRAIELALDQDMSVRVAQIPEGLDPADLIVRDPLAWTNAIRDSKQVLDFYLELLPTLYKEKDTLRAKISEIVIPFIAHLKNTLDAAHYIGEVAALLHIKEDPVWEEVKKRSATAGLLKETEKLTNVSTLLSRRVRIARTIDGLLLWQEETKTPLLTDKEKYRSQYVKILEGPPPEEVTSVNRDKLIFEAEARFHGNEKLEPEIEELLRNLEEEILRERFSEKMEKLKTAEARGDINEAQGLLAECQTISKELYALTNTIPK